MQKELEYTRILKALMELPFQVGRGLLIDFLVGDYKNKSVTKNRLDELTGFGCLSWNKDEINIEIDKLIANGMIEMVTSDYNRFVKVMSLTIKGRNEITHPTLPGKKLSNKVDFVKTEISDIDRERFIAMGSFLTKYNDEQKKAIISDASRLLCIAGAGSGKTTVLTTRVEFLVKYKNVDPGKILAVTFTKKAREEMVRRLENLGVNGVAVHTFNSFCEGILRKYGKEIYGRTIRVQNYADKVLAMNMAVVAMGLDMDSVINEYFSVGQKKFKTQSQLMNSFMNDCFAVMDYFKVSGKADYNWTKDVDIKERINAERIFMITKYLKEHMEVQGLRDYSDQIIDAIKFLKANPSGIPVFEYVLVDEYQDVNAMQVDLIKLLCPINFFAVGDPRQSIFGWRGSDINYILNFESDFGESEFIHLKKNYRSAKDVVDFMNRVICPMGLPDLEHHLDIDSEVKVLDFENEDGEREFVLSDIIDGNIPLNEIFVLARTNRALMELSRLMTARGVSHVVKEDTSNGNGVEVKSDGKVVLATIHAIKGLEAKKVFVIGANEQNFPCKATDHPAIEMVKNDDYDREEEERRLFYVAISRAREILYVTYSGKKPSYYITSEMTGIVDDKSLIKNVKSDFNEKVAGELKSWRAVISEEIGIPAYTILTNSTIDEIASKKPKNAEELASINGIGPAKLVRYGAKILEIVGECEEE
jgi:superfamily I DNA/RNA helicase